MYLPSFVRAFLKFVIIVQFTKYYNTKHITVQYIVQTLNATTADIDVTQSPAKKIPTKSAGAFYSQQNSFLISLAYVVLLAK